MIAIYENRSQFLLAIAFIPENEWVKLIGNTKTVNASL
jgi:hypothetical protein